MIVYILFGTSNSQGHNLINLKYISLEDVKLCHFNNYLKGRLQTVTYLGYA